MDCSSCNLHHILQTQQFKPDCLYNCIFPLANKMRAAANKNFEFLKGYRGICWFEEPSTRTHASFSSALSLLGGEVMFSTDNATKFSSRAKGESISDTFRILSCYHPNVIIARFSGAGDAQKAAEASTVPVINAGDGNNQHPTQTMLDLYTVHQKFGRLDNLTIALVGDLQNGRTVRSLSYLLAKFKGVKIIFVSPVSLRIGDDIKKYLSKYNVDWEESDDLRQVAAECDVVYMTRIQTERGSLLQDDELAPGRFSINQEVLKLLKSEAIIMHPLPRLSEIPEFVDKDPRAAYFKQAQNGLYIRMALLVLVLKPEVASVLT